MGKKANRNIERLKLAQELLERQKPPTFDAPDLLSIVERKNRKLRSADISRGAMYNLPIDDIAVQSRESAKTISAKSGTFVQCPSKKEIKTKKTRLT
tara:strand:+ start:170 stop:460 length:291 start_codon:yes stop_codon:yes gene_type:complete